jgi:HemY protein
VRKLLLFIVLIALIGGVVAWQMLETSGYVLIAVGNYTVEMSLWALLFLLLLVWFLLRTGGYFFRLLVEPGRQLVRQRVTSRQSRFRARTAIY